MGGVKRAMMEEQDRGWTSPGTRYVCAECFGDEALAEYARQHAESLSCHYCGKTSQRRPIAAPIGLMLELIAESIRSEWDPPDNVGVSWETREGGYVGATVYDTYDLFHEEFSDSIREETLLEEVINAFHDQGAQWCSKDSFTLNESDLFSYSWESFSRVVKHDRRYTWGFGSTPPATEAEGESYSPPDLLARIAHDVSACSLTGILPPGSTFYRARTHKRATHLRAATDLGPPPLDRAKYSNRMSPAGIPMFYGSRDASTAICETVVRPRDRGKVVTVGRFRTARSMLVLDLTNLPDVPSLFDREKRHLRPALMFLGGFVSEISKPIRKDGREHIEYVPSQVVTEYFRHTYRTAGGEAIRGILYRSAVTPTGINCVLFLDNESCIHIRRGWRQKRSPRDPSQWAWWLGLDRNGIKTTRILPARACRNV